MVDVLLLVSGDHVPSPLCFRDGVFRGIVEDGEVGSVMACLIRYPIST